jgi:hypothetical protein
MTQEFSTLNPYWEEDSDTRLVSSLFKRPEAIVRVAETATTYDKMITDVDKNTTDFDFSVVPEQHQDSTVVDRRLGALERQIAESNALLRELKEEIRSLKANAAEKPVVKATPASHLEGLVGLVSWGGDALEDTERLFDGDA